MGVGGSGKQSLSKLSAHLCGMSTYMIVISGSYNVSSLREDLQKMYKSAGLKGEGVLWLFTDSQITDEKFMVFINDLLSSGGHTAPRAPPRVCSACCPRASPGSSASHA